MFLPRPAAFASIALTVLAACQPATAPVWSRERPEPPAEQALVGDCQGNEGAAAALDRAVNAARQSEGKTLLPAAPALSRIAQSHACDMARLAHVDVEGSNGSSVLDRARAAGYPTCGVVQLVWRGSSPEDALSAWMARDAQRTEVLDQTSRQIGVGVATGADGRVYHSVVLGDDCR